MRCLYLPHHRPTRVSAPPSNVGLYIMTMARYLLLEKEFPSSIEGRKAKRMAGRRVEEVEKNVVAFEGRKEGVMG